MPVLLPKKKTAKSIWAWVLLTLTIVSWFAAPAQAAFAELINYQGKLFDTNDNAVPDDDYNIEFKLYTVSVGGTPIWIETRTGSDMVAINDGLFSVLLGEVTNLDGIDFNQPLYLSVNIGGTSTPSWDGEMSPRKQLSAVPAAMVAGTANALDATYATSTFLSTTQATTTYFAASIASTTQITTGTLIVNNDIITDLTGTGLEVSSGALRVATGSLGITSSQWTTVGSNIYFNTGNVGIGTSTPSAKLDLVLGSGELMALRGSFSSMNNFGFTNLGNGTLDFGYQSGARINFNQSGAQAIMSGTWSFPATASYPAPNLASDGSSSNDVRWAVTKSGNGASQTIQAYTQVYASNVDGPKLQLAANGFEFALRDNSFWAESYDSIAMVISSSTGNVGIGTTSPAAPLSVVGDIALTGNFRKTHASGVISLNLNDSATNSFPSVDFDFPSSGTFRIGEVSVDGTNDIFFQAVPGTGAGYGYFETWAGAGTVIGTGNITPIIFKPNRVELMRLVPTTGNLGIGTTTPGAKLSVNGSALIVGTVTGSAFVGTSTATSTFGGGINLATGCFAIGGVCVGGGGGGGSSNWTVSGSDIYRNSFVGIGTSTPTARFAIHSFANAAATPYSFMIASSTASATTTQLVFTRQGFLGLGSTTPEAMLSVQGNAAITGALRIGTTTSAPVIIGDISGNARGAYSTDIQSYRSGSTQIASGMYSTAVGISNTTSGQYSVGVGSSNTVIGDSSVGVGRSNTAQWNSTVVGSLNSAQSYSNAIGFSNSVIDEYTSVLGNSNTVWNRSAVAVGNSNIIQYSFLGDILDTPTNTAVVGNENIIQSGTNQSAEYVSVFGDTNTTMGSYVIAIGNVNVVGNESRARRVAIGFSNDIYGTDNVALGTDNSISASNYGLALGFNNSTGSGEGNYAIGYANTTSASYTTAIGTANNAGANHATALGYANTVTGNSGVGVGYLNTVSGLRASAFGYDNDATGTSSVALGNRVSATASGTTAIGFNFTNSIANSLMMGPNKLAAATILSTGEFRAPFFTATTTTATSTFANAFFSGRIGMGITNPTSILDIVTGGVDTVGFRVATTTGAAPLFYVTATSTGGLDYARVAVGTTTTFGNIGGPLLDQFTVAGRIYSTWRTATCDLAGISIIATILANTANVCGPFAFVEDTDGAMVVMSAGSVNFLRLRASTAGSLAVGEGAELRSFADFVQIANNPSLEAWARPEGSNLAWYKIGFMLAAADTGAHSAHGAYFSLNSTSTNWHAVVRNASGVTEVDTGIPHSTTNFSKFRVDTSNLAIQFYIDGMKVADITTHIPVGINLSTSMSVGIPTVGGNITLARNFDIQLLRVWVDDPPGGLIKTEEMMVQMSSDPEPITIESFFGDYRLSSSVQGMVSAVVEDLFQQALGGFENLADTVSHRMYALVMHTRTLYASAVAILPDGELVVPSGASQVAGNATIYAGTNYVDVAHEGILQSSKIFVTPLDSIESPLIVEKTEGVGFRVRITGTQGNDIPFDWFVVQTYQAGDAIRSRAGETVFDGDDGSSGDGWDGGGGASGDGWDGADEDVGESDGQGGGTESDGDEVGSGESGGESDGGDDAQPDGGTDAGGESGGGSGGEMGGQAASGSSDGGGSASSSAGGDSGGGDTSSGGAEGASGGE